MSKIEWTETVWNPTTGCDRVSAGCDNCYALTMAKRLKGMGSAKYQRDGDPKTSGPGFGVSIHPDTIDAPFHWRKPRKVFVNSMSDLFHDAVTDGFIGDVWNTMALTPQHTYQILTKRPARARSLLNRWATEGWMWRRSDMMWCGPLNGPLPNVWIGTSVEDQKRADLRIPALLDTPAAVRFLSCEPLLGPVDLQPWTTVYPTTVLDGNGYGGSTVTSTIPGLNWVIVGGESGPGARRMELDWARGLVEQCMHTEVAVFVKQLGSAHGPGKGGPIETWPAELQVREYPPAPQHAA